MVWIGDTAWSEFYWDFAAKVRKGGSPAPSLIATPDRSHPPKSGPWGMTCATHPSLLRSPFRFAPLLPKIEDQRLHYGIGHAAQFPPTGTYTPAAL